MWSLSSASAATYSVSTLEDVATVVAAHAAEVDVELLLDPGVHTTTAFAVAPGQHLALRGSGVAPSTLTRAAGGAGRFVSAPAGASLALEALTVDLGSGQGLEVTGATVGLTEVVFLGGDPAGVLGPVLSLEQSTATFDRARFAIGAGASPTEGGLVWASDTAITSTSSQFAGGAATYYGGQLMLSGAGSYEGHGDTFLGGSVNTATGSGGVVHLAGGTLELSDAAIEGGAAQVGGGVYGGVGTTITLTDSRVQRNYAAAYGGGLLSYGAMTLTDTALEANEAASWGGAIAVWPGGTLTSTRNAYVGNEATSGASVFVYTADAAFASDRHCGNRGTYTVVQVYVGAGHTTVADHVTFVGNSLLLAGYGLVYSDGGPTTFTNLLAWDVTDELLAGAGVTADWVGAPAGLVEAQLTNVTRSAVDPFRDWATLGCDSSLTLLPGAFAIDAGDPAAPVDADGTVTDLGWTGGPEGLADDDLDGVPDDLDCAPFDPGVPRAEDCADGQDDDCDGSVDSDDLDCAPAGHTGHTGSAHTGSAHTGSAHTGATGSTGYPEDLVEGHSGDVDTDTDSDADTDTDADADTDTDEVPRVGRDPGCGCDDTPAGTGLGLTGLGLLAALARRRRQEEVGLTGCAGTRRPPRTAPS